MKIAFVFAGQGAQTPGMGRELYDNFECVRKVYMRASEILGRDVADISFNSEADELNRTQNSQPAIFTLAMAGLSILNEKGIKAEAIAGFSLGECSALAASGILTLDDALRLIMLRGEAMQRAADATNGAMYAIIGPDSDTVERICAETDGFVIPVNYNCPGQTVIAGDADAAECAALKLKEAGAIKTVKLSVAGAFHTKLMQSAADEFVLAINELNFNVPTVPFYSNVTGKALTDFSDMPTYLGHQMTNPVRWQTIIENMVNEGVDTFIELGAGRVLSGLIKRISRRATVLNLDDMASLTKLIETIG